MEMYNTIGNGGPEGNIGGFVEEGWPYWYWSSSKHNEYESLPWPLNFTDGTTGSYGGDYTFLVRVIRAF